MSELLGFSGRGGSDWFTSNEYGLNEINRIKDPDGGNNVILPTAIPSPFARIDLVRSAFGNMTNDPTSKLKRQTLADGTVLISENDEKLVSDTLDIAQILFDQDNYGEKIKIISWDPRSEFYKLENSGNAKHKAFGQALKLYFSRDASTYNFDLVNKFYLIEFEYKIIGCTSPSTLFFPSGDDLGNMNIKLTGDDIAFDRAYRPLYERDVNFQLFLYKLFNQYPDLQSKLYKFYAYLELNLKILQSKNANLYNEIQGLRHQASTFNTDYSEFYAANGNEVEIIGCFLKKRKREDIIGLCRKSDFIIKSTKYPGENKPLVLQNGFNQPYTYISDNWNSGTKIPYAVEESLDNRKLPSQEIRYPFLTVSDFLEPYLIRLVYPINKEKFFDGNLRNDSSDNLKNYLLPLKKEFFDFFNTDDLISGTNGKPSISMEGTVGGAVRVILKIPIAKDGEFIQFDRIYYNSNDYEISNPDLNKNQGYIVEHKFGVSIFPFLKTENNPYHRIQLIDADISALMENSDYSLNFFRNVENQKLDVKAEKIRQVKGEGFVGKKYYALSDSFDYYQLKISNVSNANGIVIPKWPVLQRGMDIYSFAVDFGTTNTHIEYQVNNQAPKPFEITNQDYQTVSLFDPSLTDSDFASMDAIEIKDLIDMEFVPFKIGSNEIANFPLRTSICDSKNINPTQTAWTLADLNIPFTYLKVTMPSRSYSITTNLKWGESIPGIDQKIKAYFEQLIMLIRNKVLMNGGNLSQTKLTWFYPTSMNSHLQGQMGRMWNELTKEYFGSESHATTKIAESLAPFYYYRNQGDVMGNYRPVISVDIGGGTSDVVIFKHDKPIILTSIKFAGNTIFGDFNNTMGGNSIGIHSKYKQYFQDLLNNNNLKYLSGLLEGDKAEEINAFLFSLENNSKIQDSQLFSYNRKLNADNDLKIIFLYFYCSLVYHIAELMKKENLELPQKILFSGTGSKILGIIDSDHQAANLCKISRLIFEKVYESKYNVKENLLEIIQERNKPKEITCKGGLYSQELLGQIIPSEITKTHHCLKDIETLYLKDLDNDSYMNEIIDHVKKFNDVFIGLNLELNFNDHFGISVESFAMFRTNMNRELREYLESMKSTMHYTEDEAIKETLFFHPIAGVISKLSKELSQLNPLNL